MKLITKDRNYQYLLQQKQLLEERGIPAFVTGENTARLLPHAIMSRAGLWIYIDKQHYDANQLLFNPYHTVMTGIDVDEFYRSQPDREKMQSSLHGSLLKLVMYILFAMVAVFIVVQYVDSLL